MSRPRRDHASARKWGLSVVWLWAQAEQPALTAAPSRAPQVNLTVIHVEAGAYLNVGGPIYDPRLIPASPSGRTGCPNTNSPGLTAPRAASVIQHWPFYRAIRSGAARPQ